jgi:hypothetical protein
VYFVPTVNTPTIKQKFGLSDSEIERLKRYDYPAELTDSSEIVIHKTLRKKFNLFFKENPKIVIGYYLERTFRSFTDSLITLRQQKILRVKTIYFFLFFALALAGFVMAITKLKKYWFILSLTILYILTLGTMPGFRFRLPLDPIFAIYAGWAILSCVNLMRRKFSYPNPE